MQIEVFSIAKKERTTFENLYKEQIKLISHYAKLKDTEIFTKDVTKAHTISPEASQQAYTKVLTPYLNRSYNIALHPDGKKIDSFEFSKLLSDRLSVNFYIGGAYGFEDPFLNRCDKVISLSPLTLSHKIAKSVLFEQIYRGLSILNNHPYHK